ncbi:predicted protein [Uncinocarpus reesii 1704]|uniref:Uncharacterized protein n=1 Tax=Uncinocarpus reesii (strain UAMH 1704) TaxID=336963 RepID=C4JDJ9_UNCRE|nr:uncharacterized protein UREG_00759 [Uncinocarpus reesii 1704]EEP75912.1 predicted protein [Uncinocarpus reesii 1704]
MPHGAHSKQAIGLFACLTRLSNTHRLINPYAFRPAPRFYAYTRSMRMPLSTAKARPSADNKRRHSLPRERRATTNTSSAKIRELLSQQRHDKWGFLIYRCTYDDDTAWATFLSLLEERAHDNLKREGDLDLKEKLVWTVIEDKEKLDGASVDKVGDMFLNWIESEEAKNEQQIGPDELGRPVAAILGTTPRYLCCVHVDAESLHSVVNEAPRSPDPDLWHVGYVNMIYAPSRVRTEGIGGHEELEHDDHEGWTKLSADLSIPHAYACLQSMDGWYNIWIRPPLVSALSSRQ